MTIEDRLTGIESGINFLIALSKQPADPRALNTLLPSESEPQVSTGQGLAQSHAGDDFVVAEAGL